MSGEHRSHGRPVATSLTTLRVDGTAIAILAETAEGRYLIAPIVLGPDGSAMVPPPPEIVDILDQGPNVEIPVLHAGDPSDLARIGQQLAQLREEYGAHPWPPIPGTP